MLHVVDGEEARAEADEGDGEEHEQAEAVHGQAEVDRLAHPGKGLDVRPARGERFPHEDRLDEQEEKDGVGQHVRQDLLGDPAQEGQQPGDHQGQSDEEKNQRSSPLFH